jgi:hypothetical protein
VIAVAAWVWAAVGIVVFLALGILLALALGLVGLPADSLRRTAQRASPADDLPDEVPRAQAGEVAGEAGERRDG